MTSPTTTEQHYSAGAALGMVLVPSTALGILHLVHEVTQGDRTPAAVATLAASVLAFSLGVALWSGLLTRRPHRGPVRDH